MQFEKVTSMRDIGDTFHPPALPSFPLEKFKLEVVTAAYRSFSSLMVGIFMVAFVAVERVLALTFPAGLTLLRLTASAVQFKRVSLKVSS